MNSNLYSIVNLSKKNLVRKESWPQSQAELSKEEKKLSRNWGSFPVISVRSLSFY